MYYNREDKSYMNHWYDWVIENPDMEPLFNKISQLVEDMIKELLPPLLKEYSHMINIDVIAALNGRKVDLDGIEQAVIDLIQKQIGKD